MPALFLTEDDVVDLMDMDGAIEAVEGAFRALAEDTAENVPRRRAKAPGIMLHAMHAAAGYLGLVGWKCYTTTHQGAIFHVAVYDDESGAMRALIEADHLGRLRTGATTAVATEYMARPEAAAVGVFGTGKQARAQLQAVCKVRKVTRVEVYGRDAERCARFADEMGELCVTTVVPALSPDQVAADKDIVITATTSRVPVFDGRMLSEGTHLNVIGSNMPGKTEIDVETVRVADHIVCDSVEACRLEAGDFTQAIEDGVTDWRLMHELADVVAGRQTGRATPQDITLFKSVGLAVEDVALAAEILRRAEAAGAGQRLPF
jgi:ornithine cyclodeaminase/alanine dehydrogenase-like protein (mu-crystallin family)